MRMRTPLFCQFDIFAYLCTNDWTNDPIVSSRPRLVRANGPPYSASLRWGCLILAAVVSDSFPKYDLEIQNLSVLREKILAVIAFSL